MKKKDGLTACCPNFVAREDHKGESYIRCKGFKIHCANREVRDEYYRTTCCRSTGECPAVARMRKEWRGMK